jgi:hypothetical protein
MNSNLVFFYDRAPMLDHRGKMMDLLQLECFLIEKCFCDGIEWDKLCHAKLLLEIACYEYLKCIKTGECDDRVLPIKPEDGAWPHSHQQ